MMAVIGIWTARIEPDGVMLPVYMALLGLFAVGIGWIVSSLQVYLRDTAQMLTVSHDAVVLDHAHLHQRTADSGIVPISDPLQSAGARREGVSRAAFIVPVP